MGFFFDAIVLWLVSGSIAFFVGKSGAQERNEPVNTEKLLAQSFFLGPVKLASAIKGKFFNTVRSVDPIRLHDQRPNLHLIDQTPESTSGFFRDGQIYRGAPTFQEIPPETPPRRDASIRMDSSGRASGIDNAQTRQERRDADQRREPRRPAKEGIKSSAIDDMFGKK